MGIISGQEIENYIPHRFENLLIDECTPQEADDNGIIGHHKLKIDLNDTLGRQIFLRQKQKGQYVLLNACVAEVLALASILSAGGTGEGYIAFFSAITKFSLNGDLPAETDWTGAIKKVSEKAGFHRYYGELKAGDIIGSCDVMAFYMNTKDLEAPQDDPNPEPLPPTTLNEPIAPFPHKDPKMMAVTHLNAIDTDDYNCICTYTYPEDHPFIKGHFPNEPVMMGVMQWMMVEDALTVWAQKTNQSGTQSLQLDATITTTEGHHVCDIKQAQCTLYTNVPNTYDQAELTATKKVAFRARVTPGQSLKIHLKIST